MTSHVALAAPVLMLAYGILRLVDGLDGAHGPGLAWNVGHAAFLAAMVLFGVLAVGMRRMLPPRGPVATAATVGALAGVACFVWVIAGDLFAGVSPPEAVRLVGGVLFPVAVLVLLGLLVREGGLPALSPLLFIGAMVAVTVDLDLLPLAAVLVGGALWPLARRGVRRARVGGGPVSDGAGESEVVATPRR